MGYPGPVLEFNPSETQILARSVIRYQELFQKNLVNILRQEFRDYEPPEVTDLIGQLSLLGNQLEVRPARLHEAQGPLLKRILLELRLDSARAIEVPRQKAVDSGTIRHLEREVYLLEQMMAAPWFAATRPLTVPKLTDYLSIRHAECALPTAPQLAPRGFDEKFHILEAPSLFLPDLAYYRARCQLRGASVGVAFLDIDNFKSFNTQHTETAVDLHVLAPFMETLEAHVFGHGHAYRFGGDEYLLTLPNVTSEVAVRFLRALQERLAQRHYRRIDRGPTVSIGLCLVNADCFLTDREIQARANGAKNYAKAVEKGRIATFRGELFRAEELELV